MVQDSNPALVEAHPAHLSVFQDNLLALRSEKNVTVNVRNDLGQVTSRLSVGESTGPVPRVAGLTSDRHHHRRKSRLSSSLGSFLMHLSDRQ